MYNSLSRKDKTGSGGIIVNLRSVSPLVAAIAVALCTVFLMVRVALNETGTQASAQVEVEPLRVIIDAGHGGMDGGTSAADGTTEKELNLEIALTLCSMLDTLGYSTVLTRSDDSALSDDATKSVRSNKVEDIHRRMEIIEMYDNAIFVSIHQNYFTQSKYSGTQVFYSGNNADSEILAESIQTSVRSTLQKDNDRVIKRSGTDIYLLYHAKCPAVMVECGFLSNAEEAERLKSPDYQKSLSLAIASGILEFTGTKTEVKMNGG